MTPYSHASQEAIDAIIRHPQSGLRYYQHVAVCDEGPPVTVGDHKVLDRADHGIAISAFVYAAVEGRHLYLQFVLTALRPISPDYRIVDFLPSLSSGKMLRTTLWYSFKFIGSISGGMNQVGGSGSTFNQQPKSHAR